jgi:hypothetical protein
MFNRPGMQKPQFPMRPPVKPVQPIKPGMGGGGITPRPGPPVNALRPIPVRRGF